MEKCINNDVKDRDINKSFVNLQKIINLDIKYVNPFDINELSNEDKNRRNIILNELENLQNNKYNKNSFNILKELTYNEVGILGKTSFDIYNSDLNMGRFRNAVNVIKACNRMEKLLKLNKE